MVGLPIPNPTKSFWIEGANSELRNHRSTEKLPEKVDVVIIGSGYTGATTAYWMNKFAGDKKPSMLMLDARDICGCATGRNGGQLRPHFYSRYIPWSERFSPSIAHDLIAHEAAHLDVFPKLFESEGITEEVCFKAGETYDAPLTQEALDRLVGNLKMMEEHHGKDDPLVKACRIISDPKEAEEFTQMKGTMAAIVHPTAQVWPYKFVHALLRIVLKAGNLNLQANTPVTRVSEKDSDGYITVTTERGTVKAKTIVHATNRWAGHLLEELDDFIVAGRATIAAIKAPEGFIKHTGAQQWDAVVNNYHLQLPPPYNHIVIGGAKPLTVFNPGTFLGNDKEDEQFVGVPEFYHAWPKRDIVGWEGEADAPFALGDNEGGVWTGVYATSIDSFPFVGPVPSRQNQFVAAGFTGHGMPRILLTTAYLTPLILDSLNIPYTTPEIVADVPSLPAPFHLTQERLDKLKHADVEGYFAVETKACLDSSKKEFCKPYEGISKGEKITPSLVKKANGVNGVEKNLATLSLME